MKKYSAEELTLKELKLIGREQRREARKKRGRVYVEELFLENFERNWKRAEQNIQQMLNESPSLKTALVKKGLTSKGIYIEFGYVGQSMRNFPFHYQIIIKLNQQEFVEIMIHRVLLGPNRFDNNDFSYRFEHRLGKPTSLPESTQVEASEILESLFFERTAIPLLLRETSGF